MDDRAFILIVLGFFLLPTILSTLGDVLSFIFRSEKSQSPKQQIIQEDKKLFYTGKGYGEYTILKKYLIQQRGGFCEVCGNVSNLQVHHIVPISKGGTNELENLKLLCYNCHQNQHSHYFPELGINNRKTPEKYKIINSAAENQKKLEIVYVNYSGERSKRIIIPLTKIYVKDSKFYIRAFCYKRNEERIFKVSRIVSIKKLDE